MYVVMSEVLSNSFSFNCGGEFEIIIEDSIWIYQIYKKLHVYIKNKNRHIYVVENSILILPPLYNIKKWICNSK